MTVLNKLKGWLQTFPLWEPGTVLQVDHTGTCPGDIGIYPCGTEEVSRREDLMGTVTVHLREGYMLYRVVSGNGDYTRQSEWLQALQEWVQTQSILGLTPVMGDASDREQIRAEQGKLLSVSQSGQAKYSVRLTVDYEKRYET